MKGCRDIQEELSAYVDGELTPARRADIEAHVASCAPCRQKLAELKAVAAGVAALPKMQPATGFLADVRRKIEGAEKPEPVAWQDYLFRPYWLKVPLEVAVVITMVTFAMRYEWPPPTLGSRPVEMANERKQAVGEPPPLPSATPENAVAKATRAEMRSLGGQTLADKKAAPAQPYATLSAAEKEEGQSFDAVTGTSPTSGSVAAPPAASGSFGVARQLGTESFKPGDVVVINGQNPSEVRSRAEGLAVKWHGSILGGVQSKDATGQVFFVELPREYVATFKSELLQGARPSSMADGSGAVAGGSSIAGAGQGGARSTGSGTSTGLGLAPKLEAPEPGRVVLEILVTPSRE
jgi:Putative zinc-finger